MSPNRNRFSTVISTILKEQTFLSNNQVILASCEVTRVYEIIAFFDLARQRRREIERLIAIYAAPVFRAKLLYRKI